MALSAKNVLPYMGVHFDEARAHERFRIIAYQAYTAFGLIGTEHNGVAILDNLNRCVICDDISRESSGWNGVSPAQLNEARRLVEMPWSEFKQFVNQHPRTRHQIL